ncbi:MAG: hypothetical protein ACW99U_00790 [Candidatus Thorarchaeota archaeon]
MVRPEIVVATRNPKVLYQAVSLLKKLDFAFEVLEPEDKGVLLATVAIVSSDDKISGLNPQRSVIVSEQLDEELVTIQIMMKLFRFHRPTSATIGIDPGMRFGLALVIDGYVITTRTLSTPHDATDLLLRWERYVSELFPEMTLTVRIGTGSRLFTVLLLRSFPSSFHLVKVELVDESNTTVMGETDQMAAVLIASRNGRKLTETDFSIDPKKGHVHTLLQMKSKLSEGKHKATKQQARMVLLDRMTLKDFLQMRD